MTQPTVLPDRPASAAPMVRPFPTSEQMTFALATVAAWGRAGEFGAGTRTDPLLPVTVQLTGRDGNAVAIIVAVNRAASRYLRRINDESGFAAPLREAIAAELKDAHSYTELLCKACCLVRVR